MSQLQSCKFEINDFRYSYIKLRTCKGVHVKNVLDTFKKLQLKELSKYPVSRPRRKLIDEDATS